MTRPVRLQFVDLEARTVPTVFGMAWPNTNVTVSFVPDGTDVAGVGSSLYKTLGTRMSTPQWQGLVKMAFQSWINTTNLNFSIVSDDGRAMGTPGPMQGSSNVGDIRISARPLSDNVLAITNPPDAVSSWAGDIVLNSSKLFTMFGTGDSADFVKVILHEAGHSLGLADDIDPNSVMLGNGGNSTLDANDYASIQALYGTRTPDRFDLATTNSNATFATATPISYIKQLSDLNGTDGTQGSQPFVAKGDLTTSSDVDVYTTTIPEDAVNPTIVVQTGHLSNVQLRVTVYTLGTGSNTGSIVPVASTSTVDANGNYVLSVNSPSDDATYYVRVQSASIVNYFNIGSYNLAIGSGLTAIPQGQYSVKIETPNGTVTNSNLADGSTSFSNNTIATATKLGLSSNAADARWDFHGTATFSSSSDVDMYKVQTTEKAVNSMIVSVGTAITGVLPAVSVYDAQGKLLPIQILNRNTNSVAVQLLNVTKNTVYYVAVKSNGAVPTTAATYQFGIDFRNVAITMDSVASGTLTQALPQAQQTIQVDRTQLFQFHFSASDSTDTVKTAARMTIYDANNQVVFTSVATAGRLVISDVLLSPGKYTILIAGATIDGSPLLGLNVNLKMMALTDPIGPMMTDPYGTTTPSTTDSTAKTSGTTSSTTSSSLDGYSITTAPTYGGFLSPTDPYSSPWW